VLVIGETLYATPLEDDANDKARANDVDLCVCVCVCVSAAHVVLKKIGLNSANN